MTTLYVLDVPENTGVATVAGQDPAVSVGRVGPYFEITDPRTVDLSLDPSERPYGSLFGKRPDLINYGLTGFGRLTTPEAWLSTWSGLSSNADFVRCAPGVTVPTLFIELTGDQAAFPADSRRLRQGVACGVSEPWPVGPLLEPGAAAVIGQPDDPQIAILLAWRISIADLSPDHCHRACTATWLRCRSRW
jgi:hypothetical protein